MPGQKPRNTPEDQERTAKRPTRMRPLRTPQELADEHGAESLVAIDSPDDAELYPPTETPAEGKRRRKDLPPRSER